jgi:hypothetical protein
MKRIAAVALAFLFAGTMSSCILDPKKDEKPPEEKKKSEYLDFTEKWHVLHNQQLAYNEMDAERYVEILDENFISLFYPGDVGGDVPEWWPRSDEETSAREMLNKGGGRDDNPVLSISFQLANIENAVWQEVTPDQDEFPGETWHSAIVGYNFFIDTTKDIQYITSGTPRAEFQVREQDDGTWRLVRWRDLGSS